MIKLALPKLGQKKDFPDQFFALDLGGKVNKVFVLDSSGGTVNSLGSRKIPVSEDLKAVVEELRFDFPEAEPTAVVGVSGPHTTSFTTVVRSATTKVVEDLADHARSLAAESARDELRESFGDPKLSVSELEAEILEVKEADKLEVYIFTSFAAAPYLAEKEQLVKEAGLSLWGFSSIPFNLVTELSKQMPVDEELNALILDIGGSKTELSLSFGGQLMETKSFFWDFTENGNPAAFLDLWLESVSAALSTFEGVDVFPAKIFLAGGAAAFPGLTEMISSYPWSRDHPFEIAPEVVTLEEDRIPLSLGQVALRVREEPEEQE